MRIETVILGCLKKHISEFQEGKEEFLAGISEYARDNNMDSLLKEGQSSEYAELLISSFLEPFFKMPVNMLYAYFENYAVVKEFKILSNTVLEMACKKKSVNCDEGLPKDLEECIIHCIAKIYSKEVLGEAYAAEISDVLMEIDYLKGKTDKISIRLARKVK